MTDEVVNQVEEQPEAAGAEPESQFSEVEQRAMEHGWKPKEEWQGPEDDWVSAGEFVRRGELFGKISSQKEELKQLREGFKQMKQWLSKSQQAGYQKALRDLQSERDRALREGDSERVATIDNKVRATHYEAQQAAQEMQQVQVPDMPPAFSEWRERNPWYGQDPKLTIEADRLSEAYVTWARNQGKQVTHEDVLKYVDSELKGKSEPKTLKDVPKVASGKPGAPSRKGKSISSLPPEMQTIAKTIMQEAGMTEAEYMEAYNQFGGR